MILNPTFFLILPVVVLKHMYPRIWWYYSKTKANGSKFQSISKKESTAISQGKAHFLFFKNFVLPIFPRHKARISQQMVRKCTWKCRILVKNSAVRFPAVCKISRYTAHSSAEPILECQSENGKCRTFSQYWNYCYFAEIRNLTG